MKYLITLFFALLLQSLAGQNNNVLSGQVLFINSGKTPAGNVEIFGSVKENDIANRVFTSTEGEFTLEFSGVSDGHKVNLSVGNEDGKGKILEVVNEKEVQLCRIPALPTDIFEIIVAYKGERDIAARKYYKILKTSSEIALSNAEKEIERLIQEKNKDFKKIGELGEKIDHLRKQVDSVSIYRAAFKIASINKDNASKRVLRYLEMLDNGKSIEEAREVLSIEGAVSDMDKGIALFKNGVIELETRARASEAIFDFEDAITCYETLISRSKKQNIDPLIISDYYLYLGSIGYKNGETKNSTENLLTAIKIKTKNGVGSNLELGTAYHLLASNYENLSNHDSAIVYFHKEHNIFQELNDSMALAESYNGLSIAYCSKGEYEKALEYAEKSADIKEFLNYNESLPTTYNTISNIYQETGDYENAIKFNKKAISKTEEKDNVIVLSALYLNAGTIYSRIGDLQQAENNQLKALEIAKKNYRENHPTIGTILLNLSVTSSSKGDHLSALKTYKNALNIHEINFPKGNAIFSKIYASIGLSLSAIGENKLAIDTLQRALENLNLEDENPKTVAEIFSSLGDSYRKEGALDKAESYFDKSIKVTLDNFGQEDPDLFRYYNNISVLYENRRNYKKSIEYNQKSINLAKKLIGERSLYLAPLYYNLAFVYNSEKLHRKSLNIHDIALDIMFESLDSNHIDIGISYSAISHTYRDSGAYNLSLHYVQKAIDIFNINNLETKHPYYNGAIRNLGLTSIKIEDYESAKSNFEIYEKNATDPSKAYQNWIAYYACIEDKNKAILYLEKAIAAGFDDYIWLEENADLKNIRKGREVKKIIKQLKIKDQENKG